MGKSKKGSSVRATTSAKAGKRKIYLSPSDPRRTHDLAPKKRQATKS